MAGFTVEVVREYLASLTPEDMQKVQTAFEKRTAQMLEAERQAGEVA